MRAQLVEPSSGTIMRLAEFIVRNMEPILVQWQDFASSMPAAANMGPLALRDHAEQILLAVAKDLGTHQSRHEQTQKSLGKALAGPGATETAAQTHAMLRARSGFEINQLAAEYRALRASVLRLWLDQHAATADLDDIIRFNEAIDQALAESIRFFSQEVENARNLLLGMLGHDMRNPLQTIMMTATCLAAMKDGEILSNVSKRLMDSGARMQTLLDDLVDFSRTQLGLGIHVAPADADLAHLCGLEIEQVMAANPGSQVVLHSSGDTRGVWDGARLRQLLGNLLLNAIRHGDPKAPVHVDVKGEGDTVAFAVSNSGPAIDASELEQIFNPLRRGASSGAGDASSMGLGLYIAREIARAHGGEISVESTAERTRFEVTLPRSSPPSTVA